MQPVLVWVRSGENFSLGEQGTWWGASSGVFCYLVEGRALQRLPCLVRALFVGWVGVGGRSVLLRVPWSGSAKVSPDLLLRSTAAAIYSMQYWTANISDKVGYPLSGRHLAQERLLIDEGEMLQLYT